MTPRGFPGQRRPTRRGTQATQSVSAGEWIRVPVPGDPFPVYMQIGPGTYPAFIEHDRVGDTYQTVAQVRCPTLRAGDYPVTVILPEGGQVLADITIV